jgi:hypothetical protein
MIVYDLGPADPVERKLWMRENGDGVVHLTTDQRDILVLDPQRYVHELPVGMTVSRHVILS